MSDKERRNELLAYAGQGIRLGLDLARGANMFGANAKATIVDNTIQIETRENGSLVYWEMKLTRKFT